MRGRDVTTRSRDPFADYAFDPGQFDEAFVGPGSPRAHYAPVVEFFSRFTGPGLARLQQTVHALLREQGITFSLLGDEEGLERTLPLDPVPRVIAASEWNTIERGCAQRVRAMNAFLDDLYHGGRILDAGVIPRGLVYTSLQYRREMVGVKPPGGAYIHVAGIDLVRDADGTWVGFDPTSGNPVDERYVRVAAGRDYSDAAPVRGHVIFAAPPAAPARGDPPAVEVSIVRIPSLKHPLAFTPDGTTLPGEDATGDVRLTVS